MKAKIILFALTSLAVVLPTMNASAQDILPRDNGLWDYHYAPDWRESEGHPLRIVGYALHPIGWVLREAVFRPWSAFASSSDFTRSFFGYRDPFSHRTSDCFSTSDSSPDCRSVLPLSNIGYAHNISAGGAGGAAKGDGSMSASLAGGERQVFFPDVAFSFDKGSLNALGRGRVRQIAQLLASVPSLKVVVEGHTDSAGGDEYNQKLGMTRANAVINELTELGIDPARMSPATQGEAQPLFTEGEDWAHAVNRRVQFSVAGS